MSSRADALADAMRGLGGAAPLAGMLQVVALPNGDVGVLTARAAVVLAAAAVVRVPDALDTGLVGALVHGQLVDGELDEVTASTLDVEGVVVQLVAPVCLDHGTAAAEATDDTINRLRAAGVAVQVVASADGVGTSVVAPGIIGDRDGVRLAGLRVANLRATHQAPALTARLRSLGADVVLAPLLDIGVGDGEAMEAAMRRIEAGEVDLLAITSPNGARAVRDTLDRLALDGRALAGLRCIAAVGPGTAQALWASTGLRADLVAEVHTTEGLADAVRAAAPLGSRAVLARADLATPVLRERLEGGGWVVDEVVAYRTVPARPGGSVALALAAGQIDIAPVLSSSMATALVTLCPELDVPIVSIGPVTTATLRTHGRTPVAEAATHDLDGLVAAVVAAAGSAGSV